MVCELIGLKAQVQLSGFAEDFNWRTFESPEAYALFNAREKAKAIESDKVVIAADTIIELDGEIFEKPVDRADAIRMMRAFSGRTHRLISAIVVKGTLTQEQVEYTYLTMDTLSEEVIENIANRPEEWATHSGGYSIDNMLGATIFTKVNGCYYNILGLSATAVAQMLLKEHLAWLDFKNSQQ
jgi:septum formation protein